MNAKTPDAKELFLAALEKESQDERDRFLSEVCGADVELRERVDRLLSAHLRMGDFLGGDEPTAVTIEQPSLRFLTASDKAGSLGRLGHYEILEIVGTGGMGVVLKGFDEKLQRIVAIKVMAESLAASPTARRRFIREAQACAAIRDEHVIGIHAVEQEHQPPFLVMDYISGQSLQQRIDRAAPLSVAEILRIGMQTAAGLAAAHAQGLIHRDVKPANILLENGVQRVKITDFGLARLVDDASVTQSGVVAGSPQYMSPEQARGEAIDHRSDLFSLGCVLYAMCTGQSPFRGSSTVAVLRRVVDEAPRPIREVNSEIPDWLVAVIEKLLAKQPAERLQSASEVAELLGKSLARLQQPVAEPTVVTAPARPHGRSRRMLAALAALLLVMVAGLAVTESTGMTQLAATLFRRAAGDNSEASGHSPDGSASLNDHLPKTQTAGEIPALTPTADDAAHPFVVMGGEATMKRSFATLAEAAAAATAGNTIEVRGNGPFLTEPLLIEKRLTIRASAGFTPVIQLRPEDSQQRASLLTATDALVLEGLELHRDDSALPPTVAASNRGIITSHVAPEFSLVNCKLVKRGLGAAVGLERPVGLCQIRNTIIVTVARDGLSIGFYHPQPGAGLHLENCMISGPAGVRVFSDSLGRNTNVVVRGSTLVATEHVLSFQTVNLDRAAVEAVSGKPIVAFDTAQNVLAGQAGVFHSYTSYTGQTNQPQDAQSEALLPRLITWRERRNVYPADASVTFIGGGPQRTKPWSDWQALHGQSDADCEQGPIRFQGGSPAAIVRSAAELPLLAFRLAPESAGHQTGEDGQDLGVDVDRLGPGAAYERWKKTAEYKEWRNRTEQFDTAPTKVDSAIPAPRLLTPLAGARVPNGARDRASQYFWEFNWEEVRGAERYELEVFAPAGGVSTRVVINATSYQKTHSAGYSRADDDWQWHVRAWRAGQWGPWSEERHFRPAEPAGNAVPASANLAQLESKLRAVLRSQPNDLSSRRALASVLRQQGKVNDAESECRELISQAPHDPSAHELLADIFVYTGRFEAAEDALAETTRLAPKNHMYWYRLAVLRLHLGDRPGYDSACQDMLARFSSAQQPEVYERVSKTCLLTADGAGQLAQAIALAEPLTDEKMHQYYWYFLVVRGLAEFRAGRHAEATSWIDKALVSFNRGGERPAHWAVHEATALTILALTQNGASRSSEARETLASAEQLARKHFPDPAAGRPFEPSNWHDWLICRLLMREAEQALGASNTGQSNADP